MQDKKCDYENKKSSIHDNRFNDNCRNNVTPYIYIYSYYISKSITLIKFIRSGKLKFGWDSFYLLPSCPKSRSADSHRQSDHKSKCYKKPGSVICQAGLK